MKLISKLVDLLLLVILVFVFSSAIGNLVLDQPMFMSAIRSNSMYPLFERGDVIFLKPLNIDSEKHIGDIVVFKDLEGEYSSKGFIVHRLAEGSMQDGFITKGDANELSDQDAASVPRIKNEWIYSKVISLGQKPIKIPLIGHLSLYAEENDIDPDIIKKFMGLCVVMLIASEIYSHLPYKKKRKKKRVVKKGIDLIAPSLMFFIAGMIIIVISLGGLLTLADTYYINYKVDDASGVMQSSQVGVVKIGDSIEKKLSTFKNSGKLPIFFSISTNDPQISFSENDFTLSSGEHKSVEFKVSGDKKGLYSSEIFVGLYMPIFPKAWISSLSHKNYWLLLFIYASIPAIPFFISPFLLDDHIKNTKLFFKNLKSKLDFMI